jgi:hypothetical protein
VLTHDGASGWGEQHCCWPVRIRPSSFSQLCLLLCYDIVSRLRLGLEANERRKRRSRRRIDDAARVDALVELGDVQVELSFFVELAKSFDDRADCKR